MLNPELMPAIHEKMPVTSPTRTNSSLKRTLSSDGVRSYTRTSRSQSPPMKQKKGSERRSHSLSPSVESSKRSSLTIYQDYGSLSEVTDLTNFTTPTHDVPDKEDPTAVSIPRQISIKIMRLLATKKREFIKTRKNYITIQNALLEQFAAMKELESRLGPSAEEAVGDVRVVTVTDWPAHDLLLLVRDDLEIPSDSEISSRFGSHVIQQLQAQLNPIPDEVLTLSNDLMSRRLKLLELLRHKHRNDRATYQMNLEWKAKNVEFDNETSHLQKMINGIADNLKAKVKYTLDLARIPWVDRALLTKKIYRVQRESLLLQHKLEDSLKKAVSKEEVSKKMVTEDVSNSKSKTITGSTNVCQSLCEELARERSAKESLREQAAKVENMLRVARARIATLERQVKDLSSDLETATRKHHELEQQCRHRVLSYDARSKKLIELSKNGEMTIDALSRQRDALELRVKELREQAEQVERTTRSRFEEQRSYSDSLQTKVAEQEKERKLAEARILALNDRVKELEQLLKKMRDHCEQLLTLDSAVNTTKWLPTRESEPSDREAELWSEMQDLRTALIRAQDDLRQSREDKESFLQSLSRIAHNEQDSSVEDKMAAELLEREKKIMKLQKIILEKKDKEELVERNLIEYEKQIADLRLEVNCLRNYNCYSKDVTYPDLQTEILELQMKVSSLTRERQALMSASAFRDLMLERQDNAAEMFAHATRLRRSLAALVEGRQDPPQLDDAAYTKISRSLSTMCACTAKNWSALRSERMRVMRLERAVIAQNEQLDREGRHRTYLESRRDVFDREKMLAFGSEHTETTAAIRPATHVASIIHEILETNKLR